MQENKELLAKIKEAIERGGGADACEDYLSVLRHCEQPEQKEGALWLRKYAEDKVRSKVDVEKYFEIAKKTYLLLAPYDFDSYLIYLEWNRPVEERFYQPRRRIMRRVADALQRLTDGDLDELFLSMPPRVGKTSILMFYCTWLVGREPERSNLYSAFSDIITSAFYAGCLEVINDPVTYLWHDVFPEAKIVSTNAKDETFNVNRNKRYPSLTCRSLYGTLNGACDCNGVLISDDLIGGIEEALNKDRLISAWAKVDNNLLPRAKETAKVLWCGTRWSIADPAGLRMELLQSDERFANRRYEIINLPALDENDESNFEYLYSVGFSTEYYRQRRASFEKNNDMPSWDAQYMGHPVERSGVLFEPGSLRTYNGVLPDGEPDRVYMCVDPAFGGGDFVAAPVCVQYGTDIFIPNVVYSDGDKTVTQPLIAQTAQENNVKIIRVEANRSTMDYAEKIGELMRKAGTWASVVAKPAPNTKAKEVRIYEAAPDIREHFIFLAPSKRPKHYEQFMQNVYAFQINGRNKHDDAPDSLAMAVSETFAVTNFVKTGKRPF